MTTTDFIEIDYTGRVDGNVFDTTRKEDAPLGSQGSAGPLVVKLGSGQLLPGLDAFLQGKQPGSYTVHLTAEQAFGKKDAKLLRLMPLTAFGKEKAKLEPGLPITIGDQHGTVKSISGGRVVVDFNHALAGREVDYELTFHKVVTDPKTKVETVLRAILGANLPVAMEGETAVIGLPKGFPADGLVKELEKHTGVKIKTSELDLSKMQRTASGHAHEHVHDHAHEHGHAHDHTGHDHGSHDHKH